MNREQIEELAALHALGLLEGEERRVFEELLRTDESARRIAAGFAQAATGVALAVDQVTPPAALKARVLAALPGQKAATAKPRATDAPTRARPPVSSVVVPFRWIPWAVAACLAITAGVLVKTNSDLRSDLAQARVRGDVDALRIAVLTSKIAELSNARAYAVWNAESQEGVLTVENLPTAAADKDFQLWVIDPRDQNKPVDGGVFNTSSDGTLRMEFRPRLAVTGVAAFAISLERKGGSSGGPEGEVIMVGAPLTP